MLQMTQRMKQAFKTFLQIKYFSKLFFETKYCPVFSGFPHVEFPAKSSCLKYSYSVLKKRSILVVIRHLSFFGLFAEVELLLVFFLIFFFFLFSSGLRMTGMQQRGKKVISVAKMLRWMPKDGSAESSTGKRKEKKQPKKNREKKANSLKKTPRFHHVKHETYVACKLHTAADMYSTIKKVVSHYNSFCLNL